MIPLSTLLIHEDFRVIGKTISHYRILEKLGEGGMGVVYRAEDFNLDRSVALKFLPPHLTRDPDAKARFIHEAKAASALDHPNVCTIYEIGETDDGQLFLAMACYQGETLKERIARGPLPIDEAPEVTRQIAEGLAAAHAQEIVHRDIKPANIFVTTGGLLKIVDFGLAKLAGQTRLTQAGTTLGTVAYMPPEQARGEETDYRGDLWSLGCVLYEMVTGQAPFRGGHDQAVIYAIVNEPPEPATAVRTGVPMELERIIGKCLAKDPSERYQHADELLADLKVLERQTSDNPAATVPRTVLHAGRWQWRPWMLGLLGLGAVLAMAVWTLRRDHGAVRSPGEMSLAILDFRELGASAESMASTTVTELIHIAMVEASPIRVQSPEYLRDVRRRIFNESAIAMDEGHELELARASGASLVLTGRVGQVDSERFLTWRLVDVDGGQSRGAGRIAAHKVTDMVDGAVREILPLVARNVRTEVQVQQVPVAEITTGSPRAYQDYLEARNLIEYGKHADGARLLEAAVAEDSTFAAAYLELAKYHFNRGGSHVDISRARAYADLARRYEHRLGIRDRLSLEAFQYGLDYHVNKELAALREIAERWPDDREALLELQRKSYWWWRFDEAVKIGAQGFDLYPDDTRFIDHIYLQSLEYLGRYLEWYDGAKKYLTFNRGEPIAWDSMGDCYVAFARHDSARIAYETALHLNPSWSEAGLAFCASAAGDPDEAVAILEQALDDPGLAEAGRYGLLFTPFYFPGCLTQIYLDMGRRREALSAMYEARELVGEDPSLWQWQAGRILADIGRADEALQMALAMERSGEIRSRVFALRFKGHAQVALGDLEGARATALRIRELVTDMGPFMAYYAHKIDAIVALQEKDPLKALAALRNMADISVGSLAWGGFEDRMLLAEAHAQAGDLQQAIGVLESLVRTHRGLAVAHYRLGILYEEDRRTAEAIAAYRRFLQLWHGADPDLPELAEARERLAALRAAP